jgi:hypothetical protein
MRETCGELCHSDNSLLFVVIRMISCLNWSVAGAGLLEIAEQAKNLYISGTMFFNRYNTLSLPHYGLLLAGLLLRHAR